MQKIFFAALVLISLTASAQINPAKLDSIISEGRRTNSDAIVIMQHGKIILEEYFGEPRTPHYIASVGKALVSIAIIKLLNDGKIKSIDQPVSDFYPEWKQGQKRSITLRHIMSHTSGMQNEKNSRLEIETGPKGSGDDLVKLALAAEITDKPGTVWNYNNKAICLLPGIIEVASGRRMDKYFEEEFFPAMDIRHFDWKRDGTGRPQGHAAFVLSPVDLAKFGQLMLNKGVYNGKRFFEERWLDSSIAPSQAIKPDVGLIWNLYKTKTTYIIYDDAQKEKLKAGGVSDSLIEKFNPFINKKFEDENALAEAMQKVFGNSWMSAVQSMTKSFPNGIRDLFRLETANEKTAGYYHTGSWGQYLVIYPELDLVAVRLVKRDKDYVQERDLYGSFIYRVFDLGK